ncbi:SAM-dependent methyltransferase [Acidiphilium sp.]|uniref:SAM-dependent methyltransferase n=1 Tax=Acidiphilium sp. TaxID=527 RepID=UPI00258EBA32|nr:SAM-dependent methyltransferase [Acidiphilium sp.]
MPDLSRDLRRSLEATVKAARASAEAGTADAIRRLGVEAAELPAHLEARRAERNRLRAHARSLGDKLNKDGTQEARRLAEAAAYVQWHRLLFARFLLERGLLRDETGVPLSLTDCREEAAMAGSGDEWSVASAHAARLLPGVFPPDDPVEQLTLAPEHGKALRDHLRGLSAVIFQADDSLGWTYQFWRAAEKKAVNEAGGKVGAAELPAVTQLFTEPYMVRFLLHNTLGAWWAGKVLSARPDLARDAADEVSLRAACALPGYAWDYLRFVREGDVWRPAAGIFPGWPGRAAGITLLDPCCGSGHFLTEALAALAALRGAEEGLSPADAVVAALRDNLHGLEIDGRCVQIAAFALALTAWRIGGAELRLPTPHVAWVGAPPPLPKSEFAALANGNADLRRGLEALHDLFAQAPLLGSLIEVTGGDLVNPTRIARIEESIAALVEKMRGAEPERAEGALAARGMADAAAILARRFVVQATNVPFLGRGKQDAALASYLAARFDAAKADLATAMLARMRALAAKGGTVAAVTPQNWLFLGSYKKLREALLAQASLALVAVLGEHGFDSSAAAGAFTSLVALTEARPDARTAFAGLDANDAPAPAGKAAVLGGGEVRVLGQEGQRKSPDHTLSVSPRGAGPLLSNFALGVHGTNTKDGVRFIRAFWELCPLDRNWELAQTTADATDHWCGYHNAYFWQEGRGILQALYAEGIAVLAGGLAWGRQGVRISQMRSLPASLYNGCKFDQNSAVIVPKDQTDLAAIWSFCSSPAFSREVRKIDQALKVTNNTLVKVPFDLAHWQKVASEKYPNGLPEPYSDNPTQWLFHGHPRHAEVGTELHVALARLAFYRWPAETDENMRLSAEARARIAEAATLPETDADGLLALVPVLGERKLADRLRAYCAAAWGDAWTASTEATLIAAACERAKDKPPKQLTLDAWLRTHAARQHAKLFHDRPFLWWITDGRADGFTVVAHYHRLTRANLERLAYTVLGDWITRHSGQEGGTDPRAEAARVLQARLARILEGEAPYDIFVRWKKLEQQPLGWEPDPDDGVRLNIRPFIEAKVLGFEPNVKYTVDRGKDVASAPWFPVFNGERRNDHHTTLEEKRAARAGKT